MIAGFGARAERAQVDLILIAGDEIELPLRPRMLRVVVENLVTNAIRYAGPGSRCTVTIMQESTEPLLIVTDDGKGVSESDVPRLFERFYRADQARSSRGTGLGLAIVKHVVTAAGRHGRGERRPGSRPRDRLPLSAPDDRQASRRLRVEARDAGRLLVVDSAPPSAALRIADGQYERSRLRRETMR